MKPFEFNRHTLSRFKLDPTFSPMVLNHQAFLNQVRKTNDIRPVKIAITRSMGQVSVYETVVFGDSSHQETANFTYLERLVKTLLWIKGGCKIHVLGYPAFSRYLKTLYHPEGLRAFDQRFMSEIYESSFDIVESSERDFPNMCEESKAIGRHLEGCRIGFDAGGSDRKVSALIDGVAVFSEEVVWHPKIQSHPSYHQEGIMDSIHRAASHLPRVDAIGVSTAGVVIDNRMMASSLFIQVTDPSLKDQTKSIYTDIKNAFDVPLEVANDGDVTALAGSMSLKKNRVLGIAMGTSEAAGYVDANGNLLGWLNELAFVPIDDAKEAMIDEWSLDRGCGVKYLSQDAVIKLAKMAHLPLDNQLTPAENLKVVQHLAEQGHSKACDIFEMIGCYLAYAIAYYCMFYDIGVVLILGRVTSGRGGKLILEAANEVLSSEFPDLFQTLTIQLPDEMSRRVGQSIAAASLPSLRKI